MPLCLLKLLLTFRRKATLPWRCRNTHYAPYSLHKILNDRLLTLMSGASRARSLEELV